MQRYELSGKLGTSALVAPMIVAAGGLVLSALYAYISVWSPIVGYVNLLFLGGFAFGLAMLVSTALRVSNCRSPKFALLIGALGGLLCLYANWAIFEYALLSRYDDSFDSSLLRVLLAPDDVWRLALSINETGWYEVKGTTPSGIFLWVIWGLEAIVIVGGATAGALGLGSDVFCERCNHWCESTRMDVRMSAPVGNDWSRLSAEQLDTIEQLGAAEVTATEYVSFELSACGDCPSTKVLQLKRFWQQIDKEGKVEEKNENLGDAFAVSNFEIERIASWRNLAPVGDAGAARG